MALMAMIKEFVNAAILDSKTDKIEARVLN
jgi:hypothetical protein